MIIPGSLNTKSSCVLTRMIFVDKSMKIWLLFSPCSFWQSVLIYGQHICYKIGFVLSAVSHLCCHLHQIKWLLEHEAKKQHHHIVSKETALSAVVTLFSFFFSPTHIAQDAWSCSVSACVSLKQETTKFEEEKSLTTICRG